MPTVLRIGGYRLYFYSHEPNEPPHVHVDHSGKSAKVWAEQISVARNVGYNARELRRIVEMVTENQTDLLEAWYDYFGS